MIDYIPSQSNTFFIVYHTLAWKEKHLFIIYIILIYITFRQTRMEIPIFNENDSVLLVGEGNFSFSVALLQKNLNISFIATCYEPSTSQEATKRNIEHLQNSG